MTNAIIQLGKVVSEDQQEFILFVRLRDGFSEEVTYEIGLEAAAGIYQQISGESAQVEKAWRNAS